MTGMEKNDISQITTLGVLLFPKFQLLDVFGPVDVFGLIPDKIKIVFIAQKHGLIKSAQGAEIIVDYDLTDVPQLDMLLVPGGIGTRNEVFNQQLLDWIKDIAGITKLVLSVCTGSALLARSGILDNHRATSNKLSFNWVMEQGPNVNWVKKARWI